MKNNILFCLFLSLLRLESNLCAAACSFPDYMTKYPEWEARISIQRTFIGAYWKFSETSATFIDLQQKETQSGFICETQSGPDEYLLQLTSAGSNIQQQSIINNNNQYEGNDENNEKMYMCIQLFKYSRYIVQLKATQLSTDNVCNTTVWQDELLVWPRKDGHYEDCPIRGGFSFSMTDHAAQLLLCDNAILFPVLESDCLSGEGISIDFRHFQCRGSLEMDIQQTLFCLGTWNDGNITSAVVTNGNVLWPKLWLFQIPSSAAANDEDQFDLEITTEIAVVSNVIQVISNNYTLHLMRNSFTSTCQDEALNCNSIKTCDVSNNMYCQKSCNICIPNETCDFASNATIGNWIQISQSGRQYVQVFDSNQVNIGNLTFLCINLFENNYYTMPNEQTMSVVFTNGCRPRFVCVNFEELSQSVIEYRLSQFVPWPHILPLGTNDVCNENLLSNSQALLPSDPNNHQFKIIIKNDRSNRQPVPCQLGMGLLRLTVHFPSGANCSAMIDTCDNGGDNTTFRLVMSSSCNPNDFNASIEHRCLASFNDNSDSELIIVTDDDGSENNGDMAYTWAIQQNSWQPRPKLYMTYAADYSPDLSKYVEDVNFKGYIAYFDIETGPGYLGNYECPENVYPLVTPTPPPFPRPTPTPNPLIMTVTTKDTAVDSITKVSLLPTNAEEGKAEPLENNVNLGWSFFISNNFHIILGLLTLAVNQLLWSIHDNA